MDLTYEITKTGTVKLFNNSKHVKTLPKFFAPLTEVVINKAGDNLNYDKKRITPEDLETIGKFCFQDFLDSFHQELKEKEKYVYELVENAKCVGARLVKLKSGQRHELVYDNNVKLKSIPELFRIAPNKLDTVHLNY